MNVPFLDNPWVFIVVLVLSCIGCLPKVQDWLVENIRWDW